MKEILNIMIRRPFVLLMNCLISHVAYLLPIRSSSLDSEAALLMRCGYSTGYVQPSIVTLMNMDISPAMLSPDTVPSTSGSNQANLDAKKHE